MAWLSSIGIPAKIINSNFPERELFPPAPACDRRRTCIRAKQIVRLLSELQKHRSPSNSSAHAARFSVFYRVRPGLVHAMVLHAYAKINLGLRIIERRPDGFHAIETVFHRIALADELTLRPLDAGIELSCTDASLPADGTNLCWKAVECLQKECGTRSGAAIRIDKRIPMGAGLGGGSSDAAAVLRHLPRLWGMNVSDSRLRELGASIGSDVPFFLQDSSAYAEGRGEVLTPFALRLPYWILLVNPGIHVPTPWAYKEFSKLLTAGRTVPKGTLFSQGTRSMAPLARALHNDFEDVVFPAFPAIGALKQELTRAGADFALMSGSGSSVFGLFGHEADARRAQALFSERMFTSLTEPNFIAA